MSTRLTQIVALLLTAVCILVTFMLSPTINQQRLDRQLTYDVEVGDSSNPTYSLWSAAGSFRGVAINFAWQRSEALKQEGRFFESNSLAEWITTMQPRFPDAWDIQAWNMAYNISVKTKTAEERWDWVNKGMTLLRDRGIPNNPNAVTLYRSLAWILGHKMAGQTDDFHYYYKQRMAETWQTVLGMPNPGWDWKPEFQDPANRPLEEDFDALEHGEWLATRDFARIVTLAETYLKKPGRTENDYRPTNYFSTLSAENQQRFYDDHPGLEAVVAELEALRGPDKQELGLGLNTRTLRAFGRMQMFQDAGYSLDSKAVSTPDTLGIDAMTVYRWLTTRQSPAVVNLLPNVNLTQVQAFLQANPDRTFVDLVPMFDLLRALALVEEYHMDPAFMLETMNRYGPIDWRHPASHAMYWAALGTLRAEEWVENQERVNTINANRNIIHNLQKLAHQGKISYRPKVAALGQIGEESINHAPDVRMIPAYDTAWEQTMEKIDNNELGENVSKTSFLNGHENFLQAAVYLYYYDGQEALARDYFKRATDLYANSASSPAAQDGEYQLDLADFARVRFDDDLGFQYEQLINTRINLAWRYGLAERSRAVMQRYLNDAKKTYDDYQDKRQTTARADLDVQARQALPPFEDLVLFRFVEIMASTEYSLPQKAGIWQIAAPLLLALSDERALVYEAYGRMYPFLESQAKLEGLTDDIATGFPQPQGYAQWYQQNVTPTLPNAPLQPSQRQ